MAVHPIKPAPAKSSELIALAYAAQAQAAHCDEEAAICREIEADARGEVLGGAA